MTEERSPLSLLLSIAGAVAVWTVLVVHVMHQFCHETNLRMAITHQEYAEAFLQYAEQAKQKGDKRTETAYRNESHKLYGQMYDCFNRSRRLYPFEMETLYIWGRYCIDNDNPKRGTEVLLDDLYQNPNYKWGHNNLGVCYDRLENTRMARESYRRALMVDPYQIYAHFNLGIGYLKEENYAEAVPEFEATIESDPRKQEAYRYLAYCYEELGEHEKAVEAMEKYGALFGNSAKAKDPGAVAKLTALYKQQLKSAMEIGDSSLEVKYLEKLVELDPTSTATRQALIRKLQDLGDNERLVHQIREMAKYNPKDPYAWYNLALVDAAANDEQALVEDLRKALSLGDEELKQRARNEANFARFSDNEEIAKLLEE